MTHRTRITILAITAVLPWTALLVQFLDSGHLVVHYTYVVIFLLTLLQVVPTFLLARKFKHPWQMVLGTFVANHFFFLVGWWGLGYYVYEACRG